MVQKIQKKIHFLDFAQIVWRVLSCKEKPEIKLSIYLKVPPGPYMF